MNKSKEILEKLGEFELSAVKKDVINHDINLIEYPTIVKMTLSNGLSFCFAVNYMDFATHGENFKLLQNVISYQPILKHCNISKGDLEKRGISTFKKSNSVLRSLLHILYNIKASSVFTQKMCKLYKVERNKKLIDGLLSKIKTNDGDSVMDIISKNYDLIKSMKEEYNLVNADFADYLKSKRGINLKSDYFTTAYVIIASRKKTQKVINFDEIHVKKYQKDRFFIFNNHNILSKCATTEKGFSELFKLFDANDIRLNKNRFMDIVKAYKLVKEQTDIIAKAKNNPPLTQQDFMASQDVKELVVFLLEHDFSFPIFESIATYIYDSVKIKNMRKVYDHIQEKIIYESLGVKN